MRINTDKDCNIIIFDDTEYPIKELEYSKTASIYVVQLNKSNSSTIIYKELNPHSNNPMTPIKLDPQEGGFITVCHIILPKVSVEEYDPHIYVEEYVRVKDFITLLLILALFGNPYSPDDSTQEGGNSESESDLSIKIKGGYFTDGVKLYFKDTQGNVREVQILEILEVNPDVFGILKFTYNFFSVCYLRRCYMSLCRKIFKDRAFDRCFNEKISSLLIYKRDLVWAALNVIQYMIDSNQLAEAQRLLERINGCNGLCSSEDTGDKGCGCEQ